MVVTCNFSAVITEYPQNEELFTLQTDASEDSIGAVVSQVQNEEIVVSYISRNVDYVNTV